MLRQQALPRLFQPFRAYAARRAFSTTELSNGIKLAYDLHEPPHGSASNAPIIFVHGLFGSKANNRSMIFARDLNRPVYALDMRNHGDSSHDARHDYTALAEDLELFLRQNDLKGATLIGHSMGAKTVMTVALRQQVKIGALIPVDNAPVDAALKSDFGKYTQGMRKIDEAGVTRQKDADEILRPYEESLGIRQFLLANLVRGPDGVQKFRIPVKTLSGALDNMADFPFKDPEEARWEGPTLFVRGTKSHYIADEMLPLCGRFFPRFEVRDIECGHWVISEQPEAFRIAVEEFLQDKD